MKILVEYTAAELRALIDADFSDPNYGAAIERSEQALEVEQGSCGSIPSPRIPRRRKRAGNRRRLPAEEYFAIGDRHPVMHGWCWDGEMWGRL